MDKVLVVDDEEVYCRYISQALAARGLSVQTAVSGETAMERAREFKPDLVVIDWKLKDKWDGLQVIQQLRGFLPVLKAVLMTGFLADNLKEEVAGLDVYRCVEKPFDLSEMIRTVEEALGR